MAKIQTCCRPFQVSCQSKSEESDQSNTGNTIGFKTVCRGADAVSRVVLRTVGDNAGFSIIFGEMENDLHEVGTDVGNLREDTTADTKSGSAERFTNGKANEAGTGSSFGM